MSEPARGGPRSRSASIRYIESSALLSAIIEHNPGAIRAIRRRGRRVTSAMTIAECHRAVVRADVMGRLDAKQRAAATRALRTFALRCDIMAVTDEVLLRAGRPFPVEPVRTLDAIHLATAESFGEPPALVTIITRDERVRSNAFALGYPTE